MEENKTKIFWKPVDGKGFKELEYIGKVDGFEFEPLEEPIDVKYDPTPVKMSFDIKKLKISYKRLNRDVDGK